MQLIQLLTAALLPTSILAAKAKAATPDDARDGYVLFPGTECAIVDTSATNCRTGPGTKYPVVTQLTKGTIGSFSCVKTGECVTIDGFQNCGWHLVHYKGYTCYVSGQYTDENCTLANLGRCKE
ncbi:hypothetical protein B0J18DRAFT_433215 [Chaetomium sp. MPI-SDFR-AT-0129]|nr:hypothetical protein B0J18DRAFT_433215 [Chaetomium sp. MPI-SDFR-AT-0129]